MKFNQRQKDAFAKNLDNIGTTVFIAIVVAGFLDNKLTLFNGIAMAAFSLFCFGYAALLRIEDDDNG